MRPIVRRAPPCRAKWSINRPNYADGAASPMKWGIGGLVDVGLAWKHWAEVALGGDRRCDRSLAVLHAVA